MSANRTAPTLSAPAGGAGPQSALKPDCEKCGHNDLVVRMWHGKLKVWVCSLHYEVSSTRKKEASLRQRVLHKTPEPDTFTLAEVLPNRQMRRRRTQ